MLTMFMLKLFTAVLLLELSSGDSLLSKDKLEQIDSFIDKIVSCRKVSGLMITVASSTDILFEKGYGRADVEHDRPVTPTTLFPLASITKGFTAALLSILLHESNGR